MSYKSSLFASYTEFPYRKKGKARLLVHHPVSRHWKLPFVRKFLGDISFLVCNSPLAKLSYLGCMLREQSLWREGKGRYVIIKWSKLVCSLILFFLLFLETSPSPELVASIRDKNRQASKHLCSLITLNHLWNRFSALSCLCLLRSINHRNLFNYIMQEDPIPTFPACPVSHMCQVCPCRASQIYLPCHHTLPLVHECWNIPSFTASITLLLPTFLPILQCPAPAANPSPRHTSAQAASGSLGTEISLESTGSATKEEFGWLIIGTSITKWVKMISSPY